MFVFPPMLMMLPVFFGVSLACVAFVHRKDGISCNTSVHVLLLVVVQVILAYLLYILFGGILGLLGLLPTGGGEITGDFLLTILGSITSIWALLIVTFGYLILGQNERYK